MQQPPNPYSQYPQQQPSQPLPPQQQWQQQTNYGQPQSYYPPPPMPPQQQWNPQQPPYPPQQHQQPPKKKSSFWLTLFFGFFILCFYAVRGFWRWYRRQTRLIKIIVASIIAVALVIGAISNAMGSGDQSAVVLTPTPTIGHTTILNPPTVNIATDTPTLAPTPTQKPTPQSIHYPPRTIADLHGLAAKGDASAIHEIHSESVGLTGVCPQPKREVTVDPSVTGQQLAEDLLAYFYANQLDSPCGSVVFAYHNQSEANDVYTAGRILFDANDSSGNLNDDPNATNLTYVLTLDIGGDLSNPQQYIVTY
jgi:hypothetical protein